MGDDDVNSPKHSNDNEHPPKSSNPTTLHPVYSVNNIQQKIRTLDGEKVSCSSWVNLFHLHATAYRVFDHIDDTPPPAKDDPSLSSWKEIDVVVLQWIYGTLTDDLLLKILQPGSTACQAWLRLENHFLNNKDSRAATLEEDFTNLILQSCSSLEAYFQRLKEISDQLAAVDCPVPEKRLVLKLVRGLPPEFDMTGALIVQRLPSWTDTCDMLLREQSCQRACATVSPPVVAAALDSAPPHPPRSDSPHPRESQDHDTRNRRGGSYRRGQTRGRGQQSYPPRNQSASSYPPPGPFGFYGSPQWMVPPCPFPTQGPWINPWSYNTPPPANTQQPSQPTHQQQASSAQAHITELDPMQPTDLAQAFAAFGIEQP
ncbi:uncharacterized protein LOC110881625 [Helianthus annuus]|uniref:uncharacterized protein LOC110881625 n=1 Tax=Helianthus annuus TaxID=4232 RepID=UPI000B8FAE7A|nr:uncharacterized protein LOC110881625 [Helianthus annuus]